MYPERIVCLAAEVPEILHALGALDRVVGISAFTTRPPEALSLPKVGGFSHASVERILSVRPQVAILTSTVQCHLAAQLAQAGVTVIHLNPHRLDDLFGHIRLLGQLVGAPDGAEALCHQVERALAEVAQAAARLPRRPRVYFEEWMDPLICGTGWVSDLIERAGGMDVFRDRAVAGRAALARRVEWAEVVARQPELILASWCGKPFRRSEVLARPGAAEIPAVQTGEVHEVKAPILQCGLGLLDSLRELQAHIARVACGT